MSTDLNSPSAPENFALQSIVDAKNKYLGEVIKERVAYVWNQSTRLRAGVLAIFIAIAADYLWLQPYGYSGYAAFLFVTLVVLALEIYFSRRLQLPPTQSSALQSYAYPVLAGIAIVVACLRMVWQGNAMIVFLGTILVSIFCLLSREESIGISRGFSNLFRSAFDGAVGWVKLLANFPPLWRTSRRINWISWVVPLVVGLGFVYPLLAAHPELLEALWQKYRAILQGIFDWLSNWSLSRIFVLSVVATVAFGLMNPIRSLYVRWVTPHKDAIQPCSDVLFQTYRNCLLTVIAIFAVFLVIEFVTLWTRGIPEGIGYAAYAHQGAAWLVVALMMSTLTMSAIFNSSVHARREFQLLSKLAWIWFAANILLVIAVYHRLGIYVAFNGLTRLRIVGYAGVTCVLAGFVLVMFRVVQLRSVLWVVQRQAWAFFASIFILSVLPMDWIAHRWNVSRVQKGDYAPIDHFVLQTISAEGLLALAPLLDSPNPIIKNGALAVIAKATFQYDPDEFSSDRRGSFQSRQNDADGQKNWRLFQWSDYRLEQLLAKYEAEMQKLDGRWEMSIHEFGVLSTKPKPAASPSAP